MNTNYRNRETLERNILIRIIWSAMMTIFFYIIYHLFFLYSNKRIVIDCAILVLFIICALLMKNLKWTIINKRVVAFMFIIAVSISFFVLGGFFGVGCIDVLTLVLILSVIFAEKERIFFISVGFACVIFFVFIQISHPELIIDINNTDPPIIDVIEILIRFLLIFNIGLVFKTEYEKERSLVLKINERLKEKNNEIAIHNEQIGATNLKLEKLVADRTRNIKKLNKKLAEYVSFNSHKVRAPLARVLGLSYLIKINLSKEDNPGTPSTEEYIDKLLESANELDKIVKEINTLLSERAHMLKDE